MSNRPPVALPKTWLALASVLEPLWIWGVGFLVLALGWLNLPLTGESLEWAVYLLLGSVFPLLVVILWASSRVPSLRKAAHRCRVALGCVAVVAAITLLATSPCNRTFVMAALFALLTAFTSLIRGFSGKSRLRDRAIQGLLAFVVALLSWMGAARMVYWAELSAWSSSSNTAIAVTTGGLVLPIIALLRRPGMLPRARSALLRTAGVAGKWVNYFSILAAVAVFGWLSFRTDVLFQLDSPHHWSFWIGPIESIRAGGWLLWDVPSQYGFLSLLLPAVLPVASAWEALYLTQAILLWIVSTLMFLLFRQTYRGPIAYFVSLALCAAAVHFMSGEVETLSGPQPWISVGAMRFVWCQAALAWTWFCLYRARPRLTWFVWIGGALWTIAVLWSIESAVYTTGVMGTANTVLAIQAGCRSFRKKRRTVKAIQAALPYVVIPLGFMSIAVGSIALYYQIRLGHLPEWRAFYEFAGQYLEGFGAMPIDYDGPVWALLAVFLAVSGLAVACLTKNAFDHRLALVLGAWGAVWSAASYFVSRSHPNNVGNLAPLLLTVLAILLPIAWSSMASHLFRHSLMPLVIGSLIAVYAHPNSTRPFLAPRTSWLNVASRLPVMDRPIHDLLTRNHIGLHDAIACNFQQRTLPMALDASPLECNVVINSVSWLPKPIVMLSILPPERSAVYVKRQAERSKSGGWLLESRTHSSSLDQWFRSEISRTHRVALTDSCGDWQLYRCDYVGRSDTPDAVAGLAPVTEVSDVKE